jgi:transposase
MNYCREDSSMPIPFKSDPTKFNQRLLFPRNIFDLLPKEHECFIYDTMFQQIDISSIQGKYSYIAQRAHD